MKVIDSWIIWSNEHRAFWRAEHKGYCTNIKDAGRYKFDEAFKICNGANYPSDAEGYPEGQYQEVFEVMCLSPESIKELLK